MCRILVAYASRMGGTREIASVVADELRQCDHKVVCVPCQPGLAADDFDAVVLGSAVYLSRWRPAASDFLRRQGPYLSNRPTFLFQSGPCGDADVKTSRLPRTVRRAVKRYGLAEPVTFGGRLDVARADSALTRWMCSGDLAGDYRDWDAIRGWAHEIGVELYDYRRPQPASPSVRADRVGGT